MRIAICDDEPKELLHLASLLSQYQIAQGIELSCIPFDNGTELLCSIRGGEYDLILLDVLMPGVSGIQVAKELRTLDTNVKLLFLTASPEFAVESYSVDAFHYLIKPATAQSLFPLLDQVRKSLSDQEEDGLILKDREGVVRIPFARLEYVEVMNKTVSFHLSDGSIRELFGTLSDFESELLTHKDFLKVHRSYILNLRHIQTLNGTGAITRTGHTVPISRTTYMQTKEAYMHFLFHDKAEPAKPPSPPPTAPLGNGAWRILLVDDDPSELSRWGTLLRLNGCEVCTAQTAKEAQQLAGAVSIDCVVLDVLLSNDDTSYGLCQTLQEATGAPVVFLSCLSDADSQLQAFQSGGIDYICKDTSADLFWTKIELRIRLSRSGRTQLRFGPMVLDLAQRKAFLEEKELVLTPTEFDLLWRLSERAEKVFASEELYRAVWGAQQWDGGQTVQVHMSRLRRKLEKAYPRHYFIETVWGQGYRFVLVDPEA